jgi:large subunit ribosomal protein L21
MYAIIETGGKQYKVTSGDILNVEHVAGEDEKTLTFDRVLMVGGEGNPKIGSPVLNGASVSADVLGLVKGPKIDIQKYKRRKGYHKKQGHRQGYVQVKITGINA